MLSLHVDAIELWDERKEEFVEAKPAVRLDLEHSLLSISKWESKWNKPFLGEKSLSAEELLDYIRCMTVGETDESVYSRLNAEHVRKISEYISAPMTATWFGPDRQTGPKNNRIVTSELIYYWMLSLNIPIECERWHLNRLLTLIRVFNEENSAATKKKMTPKQIAERNRALNKARRSQLHSKG